MLANDFDVDGDTPLTIQSFTQGLHGTVTCAGGSCTYTPAPGYSGPDSFTYTISDGHGGTDVGTVAVTVAAGNQPPVADDDSLTTAEDTSGQVNVLDGDTDPDAGDTLDRDDAHAERRARHRLLHRRRGLHLHAGRELLRARLVHLHRLGRERRHGHGDRQRDGHARERRPERGQRLR